MDKEKRRERVKNTFNTVAQGYDHPNLAFFPESARCFNDLLDIQPGDNILDIGAGTGYLSLKMAQSNSKANIKGIDLSENMLKQAESKAGKLNLNNVQFQVMDMENMDFPDETFNIITSSFSLFFVEDMAGLLETLKSKLKKGGRIAVSSFGENSFSPLTDIFYKHIEQYGVEPPTLSWKKINTSAKKQELFDSVGFANIDLHHKDLSYNVKTKEDWWDIVWNAGYRGLVEQIDPSKRDQFKEEHLNEIETTKENGEIKVNVHGLYTIATK